MASYNGTYFATLHVCAHACLTNEVYIGVCFKCIAWLTTHICKNVVRCLTTCIILRIVVIYFRITIIRVYVK